MENDDVVGQFERLILIVGDENSCEAGPIVEFPQPFPEILPNLGVECSEGFIEEKEFWFDGQNLDRMAQDLNRHR